MNLYEFSTTISPSYHSICVPHGKHPCYAIFTSILINPRLHAYIYLTIGSFSDISRKMKIPIKIIVVDGRVGPYWEHAISLSLIPCSIAVMLSHRIWLFPEWNPILPLWVYPWVINVCFLAALKTHDMDIKANREIMARVNQRVPLKNMLICWAWLVIMVFIMFRDIFGS